MPAITLPLLGASVGLILSWSAQAKNDERPARNIWLVVLYSLMVHAPLSATLLALNPDWSFAYLLPPGRLQTALILASCLSTAFVVPYGFFMGSSRAKRGSPLFWLFWAAPLLVLVCINTLLFIKPLTKEASYLSYHNDFGVQSLSGSPLGYSLIWAAIVGAAALGFTHAELRRGAQSEPTFSQPSEK